MRATNHIRLFLQKALALALILSFFAPEIARAQFPENPCRAFFTKIFPPRTKPDPEKLEALREMRIAEYFPKTSVVKPQPTVELIGADLSPEGMRKFRADFDALLEQRAAVFHFPTDKFRAYLRSKSSKAEPYPELNAFYVEQAFKTKGFTLEELQDAYFFEYLGTLKKNTLAETLDALRVKDIVRMAKSGSKWFGLGFLGIAGTTLMTGPGAGIMNAFTSAFMKPVLEASEQSSNIMFSGIAQAVQKFTTERVSELKSHMADLKSTTDLLDKYDFNGMDRAEAKKIMDELETRYNKIFLRFKGFMPQYQQIGREIVRDWLIMQPLQLANHASTFNSEYTLNKALLEALEEKIAARGTPANAKEQESIQEFRDNMESAENRLAVTLASWKLYTFAFAEVSRRPQNKEANAMLMSTLTRYEKFMNMDKYRQGLSSKIKEAFENFDPTLPEVQKLEKRREGKPAEPVTP